MAFYDGFFDRLSELVDEWTQYKRNRANYRFSDDGALARRYKRKSGRRTRDIPDDDESIAELARYEGLNDKYEQERRMAYRNLRTPELMTGLTHEEELEEYMARYGSDLRLPISRQSDYPDEDDVDGFSDYNDFERPYRPSPGGYIGARRSYSPSRSSRDDYDLEPTRFLSGRDYDMGGYMPYNRRPSGKRHRLSLGRRIMLIFVLLFAILTPVVILCAVSSGNRQPVINDSQEDPDYVEPEFTDSGEQIILSADALLRLEAQEILEAMPLEDKVGSLLVLRSGELSQDSFMATVETCHAGGVVLFAKDIDGKNESGLTEYISQLQAAGKNSLLVCVDEEGGSVVRVSSNRLLRDSSFRSPQALYASGGFDLIRSDAEEKCDFLAKFGFNVNFAPVADVVTDSDGFMYARSFGHNAQHTSQYVETVVSVMKSKNMGSTLKHFPGYGNSNGDTHNGLVVVETAGTVIRERDLLAFTAGIEAGADSVMVTHTIISAFDPDRPASLSPKVIAVLRDELAFDGVIISDALDMEAITEYSGGEDVCVAAFLAGIDLLCTPSDGAVAYTALLEAVNNGTISTERLNESVSRIILWKLKLGIYSAAG